MPDKYKATWVSHSSISDYLNCPRAYYLKNVYKDPQTGRKITVMNPDLAMGQAVHNVLESLSENSAENRFNDPLQSKLEQEWEKISGEKGGFKTKEQEQDYKEQAQKMIKRVEQNPGPLRNLATKRNSELLDFWLDEDKEIILCGKIDWFEYLPDEEGVHIIDFKTGQKKDRSDSLQLSIYYLLADECQKWSIKKTSFWHLREDASPNEQALPDRNLAREKIMNVATDIKSAREHDNFPCREGGNCFYCTPFEKVINGEATLVGTDDEFNKDIYITN
ncbi:MAG: RecB family exonuclease [Candidatus Paceibacteria bacterium]